MLNNNFVALIVTFALALVWLRLNDYWAARGWISSSLSRKIIHIGTGPIFVLCWLLFNDLPWTRFLAALVPLGITAQFALVGLGVIKDPAAVKAMSRSGEQAEILRGPLFYGIAFVILTLIYWKDSPIGMVALMMMCGGDGIADIAGSRIGSARIPWSPQKTWAGTLAVFIGGSLFSLLVIWLFVAAGEFRGPLNLYLPGIFLIALASAAVESLPFKDIDNLTVSLAAVLVGQFVF